MNKNKILALKLIISFFIFIIEICYLFIFSGFFSNKDLNYYFYYFNDVKLVLIFLPLTMWFFSAYSLSNIIYNKYIYLKPAKKKKIKKVAQNTNTYLWPVKENELKLVIGEIHNKDGSRKEKYDWLTLNEDGLYTGLIIIGSTGTGKTSSCAYPFLDQLLNCSKNEEDKKIGALILDVKGDFWKTAADIIKNYGRSPDIIIIEPGSGYFYNPIHYPNLDVSIIAERLYSVLENLNSNDGRQDSFWKDKSINLLASSIGLLRITFKYVTLDAVYEIISDEEKLVNVINYSKKLIDLKKINESDKGNLIMYIDYFSGSDYKNLDERTKGIIKSESLRVCSDFIKPLYKKTFCAPEKDLNFPGFQEVINKGKIIILRMPESQYGLTGRAIGIMLKLDYFRTVLNRVYNAVINNKINTARPVLFLCDEYQNYVTSGDIESDSEFFARCRQSKAINIMLTQSYSSLKLKLGSEEKLNSLIGNIRSSVWLSLSDDYSREKASKICDKEFKAKITENITEQDDSARFNSYIGGLLSDDNTLSQGTSKTMEKMPAFDTDDFANLKLNQAIYRIYSDKAIKGPGIAYLHPYYFSKYKGYFDTNH